MKKALKKALFIDRDGTLIVEPPVDMQVDSLAKLEFVPGAISALKVLRGLDFELVMATNQDGLGTDSFPEEDFRIPQEKMLRTLAGEGVLFDDMLIDRTFESDGAPTRKPRTGMFGRYTGGGYDLAASYVVGDRATDILLARNLGARGILFAQETAGRRMLREAGAEEACVLISDSWAEIAEYIRRGERRVVVTRETRETRITVRLDLDGKGFGGVSADRPAAGTGGAPENGADTKNPVDPDADNGPEGNRAGAKNPADGRNNDVWNGNSSSDGRNGDNSNCDGRNCGDGISTGLRFLDHMLAQIAHHGGVALEVEARGDLDIDEHHTMEDVAIVLGEAIDRALGSKAGIGRYGFALPMDDCRALVLLDFGGRIDFEWDAEFRRERVGDVPTEMFRHFFHSLCCAARCNLQIAAKGDNDHHKAEAIFKAFARALRMAVARSGFGYDIPSSKGVL
ncbi:histidinol-phosphatase [Alistipes finegoldii]|uniref:histidinol-phosphatase n=1 Tax=Alistipes finegoldii TaxID=214856 RepID=UPI0028052473|nr:histidinol-phosphatase [uncultured Alistipes sp.]